MRSSTFDSDRIVPAQRWGTVLALVVIIEIACVASWESFWRARYFVPDDYEDTPAVWQIQRERATGGATVLIGSSRMWEDVDLTAWERAAGTRPIQLAIAGRNPRPVLRELAADPLFHGLVVCEVTPYLFFVEPETATTDFMRRGRAQTLSQRASNRLSMMLERWLAFVDNETRISTLWKRAPFPPNCRICPGGPRRGRMLPGFTMLASIRSKMSSCHPLQQVALTFIIFIRSSIHAAMR